MKTPLQHQTEKIRSWVPAYFKFGTWEYCFYCGEIAEASEHVIPWSFLYPSEHKERGITTPACKHCNGMLSNFYFDTLHERCLYVKRRIIQKYGKVLDNPRWFPDEIKCLRGGLKQFVKNKQDFKLYVERRINWMGTTRRQEMAEQAYRESREKFPENKELHIFMCPPWMDVLFDLSQTARSITHSKN